MSKIKELEKRIKALEEKCAETLRILEKLKTDNTADPTSKVHITSKAIESINPTIVPIQSEKSHHTTIPNHHCLQEIRPRKLKRRYMIAFTIHPPCVLCEVDHNLMGKR